MNDQRKLRLHDYLEHMLDAARQAQSYVVGVSKADFLTDRRTQQAVVLNLITVGEAAARVVGEYADFTEAHPEIPWRQMRGMRNRMAHGYFDINLDIVWDTVQKSLPELERQLDTVMRDLGNDANF